jgi:uncharacterized protein with von Willebrand factor type A (vWA) domain
LLLFFFFLNCLPLTFFFSSLSRNTHPCYWKAIEEILRNPVPEADLAALPVVDESDEWMQVNPSELDSMLMEKEKELERLKTEEASADSGLEQIVQSMKSFLQKTSSYEGAEFPKSGNALRHVEFNPDRFLQIMKNAVNMPEEGGHREDGSDEGEGEEEEVGEEGEEVGEEELRELMSEMDHELYSHPEVGGDFEAVSEEGSSGLRPVDLDFNLVKNLLESYSMQHGMPGPFSNILGEMMKKSK